jgi:ribonuclease III
VLSEFCRQYGLPFRDLSLLKLALTHRSYLSVTGQGPRESNERLEFLGDSVLGLVTSEFLYRRHPDEHEGQLTKTKSLLVSKAILSRRALRIGLGRFVLMSHSEVESGGRQRLSILADAFESVIGAVYLDQGFESARTFIHQHLLSESDAITSDKRHTNYKSHLQEYVQNSFRTHPVYRIRSEYGPDHSKYFMVEVMVGKRTLGEGRGHNKKEAEQAAARDAIERVGSGSRERARERERERERERDQDLDDDMPVTATAPAVEAESEASDEESEDATRRRRRGRRGGRGRRRSEAPEEEVSAAPPAVAAPAPAVEAEDDVEVEAPVLRRREPRAEPRRARTVEPAPRRRPQPAPPRPDEIEPEPALDLEEHEEIGRPDGPGEERHVDPYEIDAEPRARSVARPIRHRPVEEVHVAPEPATEEEPAWGESEPPRSEREPAPSSEGGRQFGRRGRPRRSR